MAITRYPAGAAVLTITANASAHTKGSYGELAASTAANASKWLFCILNCNLGSQFGLIDFATGAAASETVVVANMAYDSSTENSPAVADLDVDVASGTRIAARCQASQGSRTFDVWILLVDRALGSLTNPATYGAVTASSRGTQIDPGATPNTKSAYVELTASSSAEHDAINVLSTIGLVGDSIAAFQTWLLDIATGAASSEVVIIPDLAIQANPTGDHADPPSIRVPLPASIAVSTRIAARASCTVGTANDRVIAVTLIGMQEPASGGGEHAYVF